jgi:hypothetical protein
MIDPTPANPVRNVRHTLSGATGNNVTLQWDAPNVASGAIFESVRVYRNNNYVGTAPAGTTTFNENGVTFAAHTYGLVAVYAHNVSLTETHAVVVDQLLPVSGQVARQEGSNVVITWAAPQAATTFLGYAVYHEATGRPLYTSGTYITALTVTDTQPDEGLNVYRIFAVYLGGRSPVMLADVEVSDEEEVAPVLATELTGNHPNPFNPYTTINYTVLNATHVTIEIYNVRGQKIRTLVNETVEQGHHTVVWNGKCDNGTELGSGMYLYVMTAGEYRSVRRMTLLK